MAVGPKVVGSIKTVFTVRVARAQFSGSSLVFDVGDLYLFLAAALVIAVSPGPGLLYVSARSLAGGRDEGLASSFGTGLGGLAHVVAGAVGVSALVVASAEAFTVLKIVGAAYLLWLGIMTLREASVPLSLAVEPKSSRQALRDGFMVEALNPKTAAFFLAFLPQFVDPAQPVALQFVLLGLISVALNTAADVAVACAAAKARSGFVNRPGLIKRLRQGSGVVMFGLGASLLLARRSS